MFKKLPIALALAVTFGTAGYANAADIVPEPACRDWSGFYIGAHAGWLWANVDVDSNDDVVDFDKSLNGDGFVGGGLVGANFQADCVVFGVEGDIGWADANGNNHIDDLDSDLDIDTGTNAHIRARLGWSLDSFMPFIAGGASYFEFDHNSDFDDGTENQWGWNIGGGVDWAISDSFILRAEYIFSDFSNADFDINDGNDNHNFDVDINSSTVRAAIIWNFGGLGL